MNFARQVRFLLWNHLIRSRNKVGTIFELYWPLFMVLILVLVRRSSVLKKHHECHYPAKALPSAGFLPFLQSYFCTMNNTCHRVPFDDDDIGRVNDANTSILSKIGYFVQNSLNQPESTKGLSETLDGLVKILPGLESLHDYPDEVQKDKVAKLLELLAFPPSNSSGTTKVNDNLCASLFSVIADPAGFANTSEDFIRLFTRGEVTGGKIKRTKGRAFAETLVTSIPNECRSLRPIHEPAADSSPSEMMFQPGIPLATLGVRNIVSPTALPPQDLGPSNTSQERRCDRNVSPRGAGKNDGKMADGFAPVDNVTVSFICGHYKVIASLEVKCAKLLGSLLHLPAALLPHIFTLLRGFILVSPENVATRKIVGKMERWLQGVSWLKESVMDFYLNAELYQDALANSALGNAFRALQNFLPRCNFDSCSKLDAALSKYSGLFINSTDGNAALPRWKMMIEPLAATLECVATDRFCFVPSQRDMEIRAICLSDMDKFCAGLHIDVGAKATRLARIITQMLPVAMIIVWMGSDRQITRSLIVIVALICALFPGAAGLKYNTDVADVVIAFETVYRGPVQQTPGSIQVQGIGALASWIQQIATQLRLGPEKMRLAVAMVDSYYVTSLVTLNDGVSADRVAAAMASYASSTAIQFVQPMQENSLVPSVRQPMRQGDRPNAPDLIIMVILHSSNHPHYQTIFQSASWQGAEMLIVMGEYARPWHVVPYDVVNRKFVASTAVMIDQSVPLIVNTLQEILRSCPYEDGSSACFYDQSGKCVEKAAKTMRPVGDQKYCLGSTESSMIDCKKSKAECDRKCEEFENSLDWGTCSVTCGAGQRTATMKTTEPKEHYAHCQNLKYTKPCMMQPCGGTRRPATTPRKGPSRRTMSRKSPGTKYGTGMTQVTHDAPVRDRTTNRGQEKAEGTPTWLIAVIATIVSLAVIIGIVLVVYFLANSHHRRSTGPEVTESSHEICANGDTREAQERDADLTHLDERKCGSTYFANFSIKDGIRNCCQQIACGTWRNGNELSPKDKKCVAIHESGHVVISWILPNAAPACNVSIVPKNESLGRTDFGELDLTNFTASHLIDRMCVLYGGRAAEKLLTGTTTIGVANDILNATHIAYTMVENYSMVERTAAVSFGSHDPRGIIEKPRADATNKTLDDEMLQLANNALFRTETLVKQHQRSIKKLVHRLMESPVIEQAELETILGKRPIDAHDVVVNEQLPSTSRPDET